MPELVLSGVEFKKKPLTKFLAVAKHIGVQFIELWPDNVNNLSKAELEKMFAKYAIKVACINVGSIRFNTDNIDIVKERVNWAIEFAQFFGATVISSFFGPNPTRDFPTAIEMYKRNWYDTICSAKDKGIIFTVENEFDVRGVDPTHTDVSRTPEGCLALVKYVGLDNFKINFDPCNFYIAGIEPWPLAYEILKPYIGYIHLKDAVKYSEWLHPEREKVAIWKDSDREFMCVPLGQGGYNSSGFLNALKKDKYAGFIALEPHTTSDVLISTYEKTIEFYRDMFS